MQPKARLFITALFIYLGLGGYRIYKNMKTSLFSLYFLMKNVIP